MIYKENAPQIFAPVVNGFSTQLHSNNYHRGRVFLHGLKQNERPSPRVGSSGWGGGRRRGSTSVSRHSLWISPDFPLFKRWLPIIATTPKYSEVMETESLD